MNYKTGGFKRSIKGVTFTTRCHLSYRKKNAETFFLDNLAWLLKTRVPPPLSRNQLETLRGDHGRNTIHTLVSQCTDEITFWKSLLRQSQKKALVFEEEVGSEPHGNQNESSLMYEQEMYLNIKKAAFLWEHRLLLLEMTVQIQR